MIPVAPLDWDLGHVPPGIAWGGVDEAGRGAWAGPVVAACAVITPETVQRWGHVLRAARDSKQMRPERRVALAQELKTVLPAWGVAELDNLAIDRENILEATLMAMRQCVSDLAVKPRMLFIDGDRAPHTGYPERLLVDGDATSCAVACASILAKTHRDAWMVHAAQIYPEYGFEAHKGYGTAVHQRALKAHGTCAIHRLSYAPVGRAQKPQEAAYEAVAAALDEAMDAVSLQAWVTTHLRPAYGLLRPIWIETLRTQYAERLAQVARPETP